MASDIRNLLSLVDREQVSCEVVRSMAENHLRDVRARLADLRKMERTLQALSIQCSGEDVPDCPIVEALQSG